MSYIKSLTMQGFKSFVKKTELPFTPGINVILGPNGSGKSNVSDALCFVLGRLSVKSMRAAKAKNLIFLGTKAAAPAKEAMVEIVFDNSENTFSMKEKEIAIKRIVRKNGQSIYKINGQTKTRQDVLTVLAQGGIDPNGFNIILQGEIQNFARMHNEERRKVIEEVAGISIYELRKQKSLKELDKTESRLKEVLSILRERTTFLNNLEKERQEALKFKKLEQDIRKYKASIFYSDLTKNKKQVSLVLDEIERRNKEIEKIRKSLTNTKSVIGNFNSKITEINSTIQRSTGLEQEKLNQEIANIRADLAGMSVRRENFENKYNSAIKQKQEVNTTIRNTELEITELKKNIKSEEHVTNQQKELSRKKQELEKLEEERKKFYMTKQELFSLRDRLQDKKTVFQNYERESEFIIKQIQLTAKELFDKNTTREKLESLKITLAEKKELIDSLNKREIELEKVSYTNEYEIDNQNKVIEKISKIDICPLCKSHITKEHLDSIHKEISPKVSKLKQEIENSDKELAEINDKRGFLKIEIERISEEITKRDSDLINLQGINEKNSQIKLLQEKVGTIKAEINELEKRKESLEKNFDANSNVERRYETVKIEVQEISVRTEENVGGEVSFKQKELERAKISLKQLIREEGDLNEERTKTKKEISEKEKILFSKKEQEEKLAKQFEKLIESREEIQRKIRENEFDLTKQQNTIYNVEQQVNNLKVEKARYSAIVENLEIEMLEFPNVEIIRTNKDSLAQKLSQAQERISRIGSVNMRSLETYDEIKKEYDGVKDKVELISKEKESVLKIIKEIDIKKKKAFLSTLEKLNEIFSRNFAQLSTKGVVSLELDNRKDPFDGGVNILVKTGHGKYFDITSLSGGEQTLVALSLIFAIQELNPYCFYILDEIDAALDKRNSERLAALLKKYMQQGQYIVITHNDEIIGNATNLYGVSMHDGISKITTLKV
ncbi:chromosome segregation protein SMC [archaeon]|jgi:chromosome segregation protein|nr:chromosome segregation protein SMC [archaeon]